MADYHILYRKVLKCGSSMGIFISAAIKHVNMKEGPDDVRHNDVPVLASRLVIDILCM